MGRSEAALRLEFADGGKLALALRGGSVLVDGEAVGSYTAGDALDAAWRKLLGDAAALEDGPLSQMLRGWSPAAPLQGDGLVMARRLDLALEGALSVPVPPTPPAPPEPTVSLSAGEEGIEALMRVLLGRTARLATLSEALKELGTDVNLHIDEDVDVAEGETIEGSLVVIQGDARIAGTVDGDVVVVDGTLELLDGSVVRGDVRLADAELDREGGTVEGEVRVLEESQRDIEAEVRERIREELRDEIRSEIAGSDRDGTGSFFSPLRRVFGGIGGVIQNLIALVILGLVGLGVIAFAPQNLETVAKTARRAPGRAAVVGVAGMFLLIPVWVLGFVALLVSIVGIPVAIAWLPLFPLAAMAAALLGYLAVARNLGEWLADSGYAYTDWIRKSNSLATIVGGLAGLMSFFVAANVLGMVPFFGFFKGLLAVVGVMATVVASLIGFGAVLLTRAGRRPEYDPRDLDDAWERAVNVDDDVDAPAGTEARGTDEAGGGGDA